ncbi:MAG: hypothetical protein HC850_14510, partial [Rhodomicrobium sp.]|nr:hypothetical protein [Rhodomicrobium sp.]
MSRLDLTLRNARLADGGVLDIGVAAGRIAAMEPGLPPGARSRSRRTPGAAG